MRYHAIFSILAFLLIGTLFQACDAGTQKQQVQEEANDQPYAEFMQFYDQFLTDSIFQMERVLFPLEGIPANVDSETLAKDFRWTPENWQLHRPFEFEGSDFEQKFIPFDEDLIIERIRHNSGAYASERRFAKIEGKWYLIYYAGLNAVN